MKSRLWAAVVALSCSACGGPEGGAPPPATPGFITIAPNRDYFGLEPIEFTAGSATLEGSFAASIEGLASFMRSGREIDRVACVGYVSQDEPDVPGLAEARAIAVARELVARGVESVRIEAHGSPERQPRDAEMPGRERRAEMRVLRGDDRDQLRWDGRRLVPVDSAP
jgi:outer membrane protein OmpA-like peptidoglycan-associated protein